MHVHSCSCLRQRWVTLWNGRGARSHKKTNANTELTMAVFKHHNHTAAERDNLPKQSSVQKHHIFCLNAKDLRHKSSTDIWIIQPWIIQMTSLKIDSINWCVFSTVMKTHFNLTWQLVCLFKNTQRNLTLALVCWFNWVYLCSLFTCLQVDKHVTAAKMAAYSRSSRMWKMPTGWRREGGLTLFLDPV